ncbi:MAG: hypothetical protein HY904_05825 [Deltaproteobacteria bacterium]|nr:hypothetical protein [Deltaproteobacteria bacterium]
MARAKCLFCDKPGKSVPVVTSARGPVICWECIVMARELIEHRATLPVVAKPILIGVVDKHGTLHRVAPPPPDAPDTDE